MKLKHDNAMTITRLRNDLSYDDAMVRLHPCFQTRPIYRNIHIDLSVYKSHVRIKCHMLLFQQIFMFTGTVWVYSNYDDLSTNSTSENYCHPRLITLVSGFSHPHTYWLHFRVLFLASVVVLVEQRLNVNNGKQRFPQLLQFNFYVIV